jgi:hypothetical protein
MNSTSSSVDEDSLHWLVRPEPVEVPPVVERANDLPRIVDEYVFDAIAELPPPPRSPSRSPRSSVAHRACGAMSLSDIEKATLRLVALRSSVNMSHAMSHAAALLGMALVSLARWAGRRRSAAAAA